MDSQKSLNSFDMKKKTGHLIIYEAIIFIGNLFITLKHYYYAN